PSAVASEKFYHIYGIEDESAVTRGEAAAFIVNTFGIKAKPVETFFEDVTEETANYKEIMAAFSAGVVSGGGGGNFSPDNKINLMAFCVMLCNGAGIEGEEAAYENVPDWAAKGVAGAVESGLINGIEQEWSGNVTGEMLVTVYKNYIKADR
ncbi:S-layer homology domain-containing protein, partial [Tyzzerella sp. OttesenSCG-928-J15]|nr:S-layer homology domain-containing protein [Tyzzerella sp. OttesenSCG-928-J15]